jgi:hypothetical protein
VPEPAAAALGLVERVDVDPGVTPDNAKEVIMGPTSPIDINRPRTDDRPVWDVVFGVYGFPAILLAHKLKLGSSPYRVGKRSR